MIGSSRADLFFYEFLCQFISYFHIIYMVMKPFCHISLVFTRFWRKKLQKCETFATIKIEAPILHWYLSVSVPKSANVNWNLCNLVVNPCCPRPLEVCQTSRSDGRTDGRTDGSDGRTDERTDGRSEGRTDGRSDRRTDGRSSGRTDGRTNGRTDERSDGWTDGSLDGRTGGRMDGRTDRRGR